MWSALLNSSSNGGVDGTGEGLLELGEDLVLMGEGQRIDSLEDGLNVRVGGLDESGVVDVDEESNEELAVHAIGDAAVAGEELVKVLLLEGALHGRGKEATKGRNDGGEDGGDHHVELDGHDGNVEQEGRQNGQKRGVDGQKLSDRYAGEEGSHRAAMSGGVEFSRRASEPIDLAEVAGDDEGKDDGKEGSSKEALPSLVGRQLGQGTVDNLASNGHTNKVGHNIVTDDHRVGQHEPEESVINVHRNNTGLNNDAQEGHQHPGQLAELVLDGILAERGHEEQETSDVENERVPEVMVDHGLDQRHGDGVSEVDPELLAVDIVHRRCQEEPEKRQDKKSFEALAPVHVQERQGIPYMPTFSSKNGRPKPKCSSEGE